MFACLAGLAAPALAARPVKPDVVFILADDPGVNDLGLYKSKVPEPPNIDALARLSMSALEPRRATFTEIRRKLENP